MPDLATRLLAMRACPDAVQWARGYTNDAAAWRECQRGDWMLWLLARLNVDRKRLVLAACECARLSLHLVRDDEERPRIAIETAEALARDEGPTLDDVHRATAAAYAAAANVAAADAATADAQCADIVRWHFPEVPNVQ